MDEERRRICGIMFLSCVGDPDRTQQRGRKDEKDEANSQEAARKEGSYDRGPGGLSFLDEHVLRRPFDGSPSQNARLHFEPVGGDGQ